MDITMKIKFDKLIEKGLFPILKDLKLSQIEFSRLMKVSLATVNRWVKHTNKTPYTVITVLYAWLELRRHNLPWHPDTYPNPIDALRKVNNG